jgi:hypothetical protein
VQGFDFLQGLLERAQVAGVSGEHHRGERITFARHDQCDDHVHTKRRQLRVVRRFSASLAAGPGKIFPAKALLKRVLGGESFYVPANRRKEVSKMSGKQFELESLRESIDEARRITSCGG